MHGKVFGICLTAVLACVPLATQAEDRPLQVLAQLVPEAPQGWVSLANIAAVKEQARPFAKPPSEVNLGLMAFAPIHPGLGFDAQSLGMSKDLYKSALGFSVGDIAGLATWGEAPDGPAIVTFADRIRPSTIGPALTKRGYVVDTREGVPVWHRQEDHKFDLERLREDPFTGRLGLSGRFAVTNEALIFTRAWPMMDRILKADGSFGDRPEVQAILDAAYGREGLGDLLEALFIGPQSPRMADMGLLLGGKLTDNPSEDMKAKLKKLDYPGLPPFLNHALLSWQDGTRLTGAVAIPYLDEATARQALKRFVGALKVAESFLVKRVISDMLPEERTFTVLPAGDRFVLLLMFHQQAREQDLDSVLAFRNNPVGLFTQLIMTREWTLLTGFHE